MNRAQLTITSIVGVVVVITRMVGLIEPREPEPTSAEARRTPPLRRLTREQSPLTIAPPASTLGEGTPLPTCCP
jgi:hypothetical protein